MENALLGAAMALYASAQLEHAAGIRSGDDLRLSPLCVAHLLFEDRCRHLVVDDVVNAGAAAAQVRHRHFDEVDSRDGLQQLTRRGFYLLSMREMAGILIRDTHARHGPQVTRVQASRREELCDIADFGSGRHEHAPHTPDRVPVTRRTPSVWSHNQRRW